MPTRAATPARKTEKVSVQEESTPEDAKRIGTLDSVMSTPEPPPVSSDTIEVGAPEDVAPRMAPGDPNAEMMRPVSIRVNDTIEEMSYVAGGMRMNFSFEAGHEYTVPVCVAKELEQLGKVWH